MNTVVRESSPPRDAINRLKRDLEWFEREIRFHRGFVGEFTCLEDLQVIATMELQAAALKAEIEELEEKHRFKFLF